MAAGRRFRHRQTDLRVVQLTPPGSPCSIHFGKGVTTAAPGSAKNLYLVVSDIEAAREELVARGADVSEAFHFAGFGGATPCRARTRTVGSYTHSCATFSDPDGNSWLLQEIKTRLPGRGLSSLDVATLTELLQETETAPWRVRADRAETPLVGLVRRLHRRAPAGKNARRGGQGCHAPHGHGPSMRADIVPGAAS